MVDFLEVIRRTESGAFLSERDFDIEVIFKTTRELVKKHGLKYDRKQLITLEPEMADGAFQAGLELAEQAGMFCVNTSRVIKLTREELQKAAGLKDREHFRKKYLGSLLTAGWLEMMTPDKPRSSEQRYRTTDLGRKMMARWSGV